MPQKDDPGDSIISETGNWNVAADFSKEKIMIPLINCDIYEDLASFGYETILEQIVNYNSIPQNNIKIIGLDRLIAELIRICKNSKFAMKKQGTKVKIEKYEKQLKKIRELIPSLYKFRTSQVKRTKEMILDTAKFNQTLEIVSQIKSDINEPLNQNHLIFTDRDEFDPAAFKEKIKNRMKNKG